MKRFHRLKILLSLFVISGCLASNADPEVKETINVETLYSNSNCSSNQREPSALWITSQEQFNRAWKGLQSLRVGENSRVMPQVNFATHNVLLIHMGMRKSGGYHLELAETTAFVNEKTATVYINWAEPKQGSFVTQALTSPCLLLKFELGDYQTTQVRDKSGKLRITTKKP